MGGSEEHVVVKGSLGDGDEGAIKVMMGVGNLGDEDRLGIDVGNGDEGANKVMMGATNLGDADGLGIDVGNNCGGVVGKSTNPPRN
jgi:hypothetical protein